MLDGKRNRIYIFDLPGLVGPRRGRPLFSGEEAIAAYFLANSVRYVAMIDFDKTDNLYSRKLWKAHAAAPDVMPVHQVAPYIVRVLDAMEQLSKHYHHVYDGDGMMVVDLTTPA